MLRGFLNRSSFEAEGQFKRAVHLAFDPICFCSSLKVVQTDVTTCVRFFTHQPHLPTCLSATHSYLSELPAHYKRVRFICPLSCRTIGSNRDHKITAQPQLLPTGVLVAHHEGIVIT
jgi:hypothetical protein